jgi:hypothetical protein
VGDGSVHLGEGRCREGAEGAPGDGGRRFVASEPVERAARIARAARTPVVLTASWKLRIASVT